MLPMFFTLMATLCLVTALFGLWQSLRAAFGAAKLAGLEGAGGSTQRAALLDEKEAILANIKDLRFEYECGKISKGDWQTLDRQFRKQAKHVLRLLDEDIATYRTEAERIIQERIGGDATPYRGAQKPAGLTCHSCGKGNDADAEWCKACGTRLSTQACSECGTTNDPDAAFCKKCGHGLQTKKAAEKQSASKPEKASASEAQAEQVEPGDGVDEAASEASEPSEGEKA